MSESNGTEGSAEEAQNHEALEVLRDTLREVFYEPTEQEVKRVEEGIESLSSDLDNIRREQRKELDKVQRSIEEKFTGLGETYRSMEEALRGLQEASTQMSRLLENDDGDSRIKELAQEIEKDAESLERSIQSFKEASLEFHRSHAESLEEHSGALREHDEHLEEHHAAPEEYSKLFSILKEVVQDVEAGLNDRIEAMDEDLGERLDNHHSRLQTVDEKARNTTERLQAAESELSSQIQEVTEVARELQTRQSHILMAVGLTATCMLGLLMGGMLLF